MIGFDRPMRLMLATDPGTPGWPNEDFAWPALLDVVRDHGPAELIRQVRAAEDSDRDCERWPRDKPMDDATVVYWHCG